ncbi:MAG TPA: adenylate/guanylate cyclase domain-containing protein [Solirubrobacteraceae bacterium]|nr:adenylate/guanylate cyclase domain-containing protein [Solirubrobacteraceae bacterium]
MIEPSGSPEHEPWLEVAEERLGRDVASVRRITRARRGRMLDALATIGRSRGDGGGLDPELLGLLQMIGLDPLSDDSTARELALLIDRGAAAGLDRAALPHVLQAYVRAVNRIATVEAGVALDALRAADPAERPTLIANMIDELLPISLSGFDLLHRAMLHDALLEGSDGFEAEERSVQKQAIGMVDLVRSTDHLARASVVELEHLVDVMFAAGQAATAERSAHVVKYVGDGAFIAAADVISVADAALEMIARLEHELPLRARGGISFGGVVQRAGDIFGMPVNLASALTKATRPGTVLLSASAAAELPPARRGRLRSRALPHPGLGEQIVATLRAPGGAVSSE